MEVCGGVDTVQEVVYTLPPPPPLLLLLLLLMERFQGVPVGPKLEPVRSSWPLPVVGITPPPPTTLTPLTLGGR